MIDASRFMADGLGVKAKMIKSIQLVQVATPSDATGSVDFTIDEVVPENCIVLLGSFYDDADFGVQRVYVSSSTKLTCVATDSYASEGQYFTAYVIEFHPSAVKSRQTGAKVVTSLSSPFEFTQSLSTIDPTKAFAVCYYSRVDATDHSPGEGLSIKSLTADTLTFKTNFTISSSYTFYWEVLELR